MEETVCNIEILKDNPNFVVRIETFSGKYKEYEHRDFETLLSQVYEDLEEEINP